MDPHQLFIDSRITGICAYCGAQPETRDHVPSKVLLDEPYPRGLPVVGACSSCNFSFSLNEQYLACFIECVVNGSVQPTDLQRSKIRRVLSENPALRCQIESSQTKSNGKLLWLPELDRVQMVLLKLARGHAAYELYARLDDPIEVAFKPLLNMTNVEREEFETVGYGEVAGWPEIGTRAFLRVSGKQPDGFTQSGSWLVVQPDRYRYAVLETGGVLVKMVLSEYLACTVVWD